MKNKKKLIVIAVALALVLAVVAVILFSPKTTVDRKIIEQNAPKDVAAAKYLGTELEDSGEEYALVAEKAGYQLYYRTSDYTMKVVDTKTGTEWKSLMTDEDYIHNADQGNTENNETVRNRLKKLFEIGVTNFEELTLTTSLIDEYSLTVKHHKLENGFAIEALFDTYGIGVTIEFWLDENGLNARVPVDKIKEEAEYGLMSLTLLPMFGAAADTVENAFVLMPDASGGIYDVKPNSERQTPLTIDTYFSRDFDLDKIQSNNQQGIKNSMMPFFGVSKGASGFVGYIAEGEMNSYITFTPSSSYKINRVSASVAYRKSYTYINPASKPVTAIEKNISAKDFTVRYGLLTAEAGDKVTYADMAVDLQKYLVSTGKLVKTESTNDGKIDVNLQMIMSTKVETMISKYLKVMTKCSDIENMIAGLPDDVQKDLRIMLLGWQSSGYNIYPSSGKFARGIGSVKELSKFLKDKGIESYLLDDYVYATTESGNFSEQSDAVYNEAKIPVTNKDGNQYMRNAYKEYLTLTKDILPYLAKSDVYGIGFDKAGWYVYDDFQKRVELTRYDTVAMYNAMFNATEKKGMKVAIQRGNVYTLNVADYLYDLPLEGSGIKLLDRDVPFYEMVVHGYIPYSMDTPGNMAIDYDVEKLKWIEYGAEPTFLLTDEMSEEFKDSKVENAFATELDNWTDDIAAVSKEFNSDLAFTAKNTMVGHDLLASGVVRVTYSNGSNIYINYNKQQVTVDDVTIDPIDYVIVG